MAADCLAYLNSTSPNDPIKRPASANEPPEALEPNDQNDQAVQVVQANQANKIRSRRYSVAGASMFSINNEVVESGGDYFGRVARGSYSVQCNESNIASNASIGSIEPSKSQTPAEEPNAVAAIVQNVVLIEPKGSKDGNDENIQHIQLPEPSELETIGTSAGAMAVTTVEIRPSETHIASSATNAINIVPIFNNFDPFRRLPNLPFALKGRKRLNSMFEPELPSIFEE